MAPLITLQSKTEQLGQLQKAFDTIARATSLRTLIGVLSKNREAYNAELANWKQIFPDQISVSID